MSLMDRTLPSPQQATYTIYKLGNIIIAEPSRESRLPIFSGESAAAVIQSAVDALTGGGKIFIKSGVYLNPTRVAIYLRNSGVRVIGEGMGNTILRNMGIALGSDIQGANAPLVRDVSLESLTIDGVDFPNNGSGIGYRNVERAVIKDVKVYRVPFWSIFGAFESGVPKSQSLYLIDSVFDRANETRGNQDMTAFNYLTNLYVRNCIFMNNTVGSTFLPYSYVDNIYIDGLFMKNCTSTWALNIGLGDPPGSVKNVIANNIELLNVSFDNFITPSVEAIVSNLRNPDQTISIGGQKVSANNISASSIKIMPYGHDETNYVKGKVTLTSSQSTGQIEIWPKNGIDGSILVSNLRADSRFIVILSGFTLTSTLEVFLENSYFNGGITLTGFEPASALVTYIGHIKNCYTGSAYAGGTSGKIRLGQILGKTGFPFVLEGNIVYNAIEFTATTLKVNFIMKRNKAYLSPASAATENSGTATITAGNTYVDVTHGLAITPDINEIKITPKDNLGGRSFWVSDVTSTTFRINISSADTVDHVFGWCYG